MCKSPAFKALSVKCMEKQTLITGEGITDIDYTVYISVTSVFRPADVTDTLDHMREPKSK